MLPKRVEWWKLRSILLQVEEESKRRIQCVQLARALGFGDPLPPRMDPLTVEDVVWACQKARCEEFEQVPETTMAFPKLHRRTGLGELHELAPQIGVLHEVRLEGRSS